MKGGRGEGRGEGRKERGRERERYELPCKDTPVQREATRDVFTGEGFKN